MKKKMDDKEKLDGIREAYPTKEQGRRTKDGYPSEFCYDEFAYKRMVRSFRRALKTILKKFK